MIIPVRTRKCPRRVAHAAHGGNPLFCSPFYGGRRPKFLNSCRTAFFLGLTYPPLVAKIPTCLRVSPPQRPMIGVRRSREDRVGVTVLLGLAHRAADGHRATLAGGGWRTPRTPPLRTGESISVAFRSARGAIAPRWPALRSRSERRQSDSNRFVGPKPFLIDPTSRGNWSCWLTTGSIESGCNRAFS
jgi:hypothetical protein